MSAPGPTVAIMQPYFFPYAGYFRLFLAADLFVIYDCVQFPRRGRVHRSEVPGPGGTPEWLTLPLAHQPRDTPIRDLAFAEHAATMWPERLSRYPWWRDSSGNAATERLRAAIEDVTGPVADYLIRALLATADLLGLPTPTIRSSSLDLDPDVHGQDRILAIASALGAGAYVNAPGGRLLYQAEDFARRGMTLRFLAPYDGPFMHLLPALFTAEASRIRADIARTTTHA